MHTNITDPLIHQQATQIIKGLYGPTASFRDGQYEAIEATMTQKRVLVVQRTGWGKSLVYFICTKLMRKARKGVTMVISPLHILKMNQLPYPRSILNNIVALMLLYKRNLFVFVCKLFLEKL